MRRAENFDKSGASGGKILDLSVGPAEEQSHWFHRYSKCKTAVPLVSALLIRSVFRRTDLLILVASVSPNHKCTKDAPFGAKHHHKGERQHPDTVKSEPLLFPNVIPAIPSVSKLVPAAHDPSSLVIDVRPSRVRVPGPAGR